MEECKNFSCAVITMSDKGAAGTREDTSGPELQKILASEGYSVDYYTIVPDNENSIAEALIHCIDEKCLDLIVTTGGTGVSPTDVTPEATRRVLEKEVPGMAEAMRAASLKKTHHAVLSRGVVGIRHQSLVINLPGSKKAAVENLEVLLNALPHALKKIKGDPEDCATLQ